MSRIPDKWKSPAVKRWFKRVGVWGFLFFLIKGLVWLAIAWWALLKK
ncbi:alanyl-tRNA synthetase [Niabella beijingensis]|nr:alanyl-tRNA synthetase [Niabella beijingensis]MBZ4192518.1 alanyl-tRNA synthetase [Niabella beijingensis]